MRPKSLEETLTNLELNKYNISKMLYGKNLIYMSLRFNRSDPIFRTKRELRGIGRRRRTRDDIRLGRNLPFDFMIVRQKRDQTFVFRIVPALNFNFHLLT